MRARRIGDCGAALLISISKHRYLAQIRKYTKIRKIALFINCGRRAIHRWHRRAFTTLYITRLWDLSSFFVVDSSFT